MTSIGEKFRKLRKEQNITLVQASKGICDPSNLSRWENGKITLEFNKVLALLNHIHVTPTDFINYAKLKQENEIPQEYIEAIDKEDNAQIKTLALKQLKIYHTKRKIYDLYLAIILCNQYLLITGENLLPFQDQMHLYTYLSKTTIWTSWDLSFFGNCVFMIKPDKVYAIAMNVLHNHSLADQDVNNLMVMLGILGDATISLIFRKDVIHAQKLLNEIKAIEMPHYLEFFTLVFTFLEKVIQYTKTHDKQIVLTFIDIVQNLGLIKSTNIFIDIFKHVQVLTDY